MLVVDTYVVTYLLVRGERTPLAQALWERDPDWCLPSIWQHEFLNVLATIVKVEGMKLADAAALWRRAIELLAAGEREIEMLDALRLTAQHRISAYDAQFVALAQRLGVPLVTEDRRLREAVPELALSMAEVCG